MSFAPSAAADFGMPLLPLVRIEAGREVVVAVGQAIDERGGVVVHIYFIVAAEILVAAADDFLRRAQIPRGAEIGIDDFGEYRRFAGLQRAEAAEVETAGGSAVVVVAPAGHVLRGGADVGEFDELAFAAGNRVCCTYIR